MAGYTDFPALKQAGDDSPQQVAKVVNGTLQGKINAGSEITFRASQTTTIITDDRLNTTSNPILMPKTANARTALNTAYVSARSRGSVTFTHASAAAIDQTFIMTILH